MLKVAFWEQTMGKTSFWLVSEMKSDVAITEDAECSGCLLTSKIVENVYQLKELVLKKRRIVICEVGNGKYIWVSSEHFQRQSEHARIAVQFMPCLLSVEQKESHVSIC
jgi:adenine specific DNA methylase Mod